ncbi:hypothetical protein JAAARDRAFT_370706 [Jaapia argillacea MUCL 33604]|uniref:Secreted protein n=1 Tax=Jaapia argillacea MUCL 33604 TaxID=933084 RepID=A0A067QAJ9_9AGAM|nr:hypothetical protein JAAARDRAFT_370706 [Jaapia argillacea MUCL 33604]
MAYAMAMVMSLCLVRFLVTEFPRNHGCKFPSLHINPFPSAPLLRHLRNSTHPSRPLLSSIIFCPSHKTIEEELYSSGIVKGGFARVDGMGAVSCLVGVVRL